MVGAFVGDGISIHALRKESDTRLSARQSTPSPISIHALRKESDQAADHVGHQLHISIHALRKESDACRLAGNGSVLISIHALRKESDRQTPPAAMRSIGILIHALRKESDFGARLDRREPHYFNPRSP